MRVYGLLLCMVTVVSIGAMEPEERLMNPAYPERELDLKKPPIYILAGLRDSVYLKKAIQQGLNVNAYDPTNGTSFLWLFVDQCVDPKDRPQELVEEMIDLMVEKGLDLQHKNKYGRTILHKVVTMDLPFLLEKLVVCGADINAQNNNGNTPLHDVLNGQPWAIETIYHINMAQKLLELGANVHIKNNDNITPLHRAVDIFTFQDCKKIVPVLLAYGACVYCKNSYGQSVYDCARTAFARQVIKRDNFKTTRFDILSMDIKDMLANPEAIKQAIVQSGVIVKAPQKCLTCIEK